MEFSDQSLPVLHFSEPALEFAFGQTTAHPKDGLFLYGPHNKAKKTREVRIGVIGTASGIGHFRSWASQIKKRVEVPPPGKTEKKDRLHLANFPGIEEAFGISFNEGEFVTYTIDLKAIDVATRILNLHEAVSKVVQLYVDRARRHIGNEERAVDVCGYWCCRKSSLSVASRAQSAPDCQWKKATLAKSRRSGPICRC